MDSDIIGIKLGNGEIFSLLSNCLSKPFSLIEAYLTSYCGICKAQISFMNDNLSRLSKHKIGFPFIFIKNLMSIFYSSLYLLCVSKTFFI